MARPRRDLAEPAAPVDHEREFRRLSWLLAASDPPHPLRVRLRRERDAIRAGGGPPEEQLEALRTVVDGLGLRGVAERHLAQF